MAKPPIRVGLLHSRTGPLASLEHSLLDAEIMALEEINAQGGLLGGRPVQWVVADGASDDAAFAREARRLIRDHKVKAIFGCYSSSARKAVARVVGEEKSVLFYALPYEGLEDLPRVVYLGAAPNQQVIPTVKWVADHLQAQSFYLIGDDSIYSRGVNEIIKDELFSLNRRVAGEYYVGSGGERIDKAVAAVQQANPDVVVNAIQGPSYLTFCHQLRVANSGSRRPLMISYAITEEDIVAAEPGELAGDYVAASYFMVLKTSENRAFVQRFQARFGRDRVTTDPIEATYLGVKLWAQAVEEAGRAQPDAVLGLLGRQSYDGPEGVISVDGATRHVWRPAFIGKIGGDGRIEIMWNSEGAIQPWPFPDSRTREEWLILSRQIETSLAGNRGQNGARPPAAVGPPLPAHPPVNSLKTHKP